MSSPRCSTRPPPGWLRTRGRVQPARLGLATFSHAWLYPAQRHGWRLVAPEKMGSWLLLAIISFILVTLVQPPRPPEAAREEGTQPDDLGRRRQTPARDRQAAPLA
jgi:hypothetical protein